MSSAIRPANLNGLASRFVKSFRIRQALRELSVARSVLDLGCGLCELTEKLPPAIEYVGVERDAWMYERAVAAFPKHRFIKADIEAAAFDPQFRADAVVMLAVWEHLKDPVALLSRASEWTTPGGSFILTTPSPAAHRVLDAGASIGLLSRHADEEHERLWAIGEITAAAERSGWRVAGSRRFLGGLNQIVILTR